MPESDTLTIRIAADDKKRLFEEAKAEDRSVTSYIVHLLHVEFAKRDEMKLVRKSKVRG